MGSPRPAIIDPRVAAWLYFQPLHNSWVILCWVVMGAAYWEGNRLCRMQDGYPIVIVVGPRSALFAPSLPPV